MSQLFERILLATERTEFDAGAERVALAMARRCARPLAVVMPLASNAEYEAVAPQLAERDEREAAARLEQLRHQAQEAGVELEFGVRRGPETFAEIVAEARESAADLIVIRRRGRRGFLARMMVGEMVGKVIAHAPCKVLVVPREAALWQRRVLVVAGPGEQGRRLVALATAVAAECALPLSVVALGGTAGREPAEAFVAEALQGARRSGVQAQGEVLAGEAPAKIADAARRCEADLIVMDARGPVARQVTGETACAVLLVPLENPMDDRNP